MTMSLSVARPILTHRPGSRRRARPQDLEHRGREVRRRWASSRPDASGSAPPRAAGPAGAGALGGRGRIGGLRPRLVGCGGWVRRARGGDGGRLPRCPAVDATCDGDDGHDGVDGGAGDAHRRGLRRPAAEPWCRPTSKLTRRTVGIADVDRLPSAMSTDGTRRPLTYIPLSDRCRSPATGPGRSAAPGARARSVGGRCARRRAGRDRPRRRGLRRRYALTVVPNGERRRGWSTHRHQLYR